LSALAAPSRFNTSPSALAASAREYADTLRALDAPFESLAKERALARAAGRERGAQRRAAPGLVPIENNCPAIPEAGRALRVRASRVQIDGHARRMKRMRGVVEHSMRLAESQLVRQGGFRFKRLLVTLTYAKVDGWKPEDISAYVRVARKWAIRKGFPLKFTWVAELQKRGAVHYHVCMWIPVRCRLPEADLYGWWVHGSSNVKKVYGGASGVMAYLGKYLTKGGPEQSMKFPKGARMFGAGGLDCEQRREMRYRLAPFWVRDELGTFADIRRIVGGWVDRESGLFVASPWKIEIDGAGRVWCFKPAV